MSLHSFPKQERLKRQKAIQQLFKVGKSFSSFPLRLVYLIEPTDSSSLQIQFAATVPKKKFAKAVHRNRIRRQIKESYRLEKHLLAENLDQQHSATVSIMMIYVAKEELPFTKIDRATKYLIQKLSKTLVEHN